MNKEEIGNCLYIACSRYCPLGEGIAVIITADSIEEAKEIAEKQYPFSAISVWKAQPTNNPKIWDIE